MKRAFKIIVGWLLITAAYMAVFIVFGMFVSYDSSTGVTNFYRTPQLKPVLGALLTIIPYTLAGFYCRKAFKGQSLANAWMLSIIPSIGDKLAIYLLSALIYSINPLSVVELMYRINSGGDQTAPFFTYGYIILSIIFANLICVGLASLPCERKKRQIALFFK